MSKLFTALLALSFAVPAAAGTAVASSPVAAAEKIRCKREVETGSLVKATRVCRTEAEWDALRRQARDERIRLQGPGAGPGGQGTSTGF